MPTMMMRQSNPALFEEGLSRRGQCVWWLQANSCFCVSDNGRVDPNCPKCFGSGFLYSPVTHTRRIIKGATEGRATINLPELAKGKIQSINRLTFAADTQAEIDSFTSRSFTPKVPVLAKGILFTLDYEADLTEAYAGPASYGAEYVIDVPLTHVHNQGTFQGQLHTIQVLNRVDDPTTTPPTLTTIPVVSVWGNKILTTTPIFPTDVFQIECVYVLPVTFLITGIDPKKKIDSNTILAQADAQMTFPGTYSVGRGDAIILQMGEIRESFVGVTNPGDTIYKFPYFKVRSILKIEDALGEITDAVLVNDNEIKWGSRVPHRFSVMFVYYPVFSVLDNLPSVRYAEDKIWPKKVFLRKFPLFTRASKVLTPKDPGSTELGLVDDPRKGMESWNIL